MTELTSEEKMLRVVVKEAWENPSFKEDLIAAPLEAIKEATGESIDLPEGVELRIHDQTDPHTVYINIPPKPDYSSMELTDEQLEIIAGGEVAVTAVISAVSASLGTIIMSAQLSYTIGYNSGW